MASTAMNSSRKRPRGFKNCQACRERHSKCDDGEPSCRQCRLNNTDCVRHVNGIRFRSSYRGSGTTFPPDQVWLQPPLKVRYRDETSETVQQSVQTALDVNASLGETIISIASHDRQLPAPSNRQLKPHSSSSIHDYSDHDLGCVVADSYTPGATEPSHQHMANSYGQEPSSSQPMYYASPSTISVALASPTTSIDWKAFKSFTEREAELVRNFSENMAIWVDVTDSEHHFEIEAPRRALYVPILRYAICAFSSRHLNRSGEGEALYYHSKCLELLIPRLSEGQTELRDDVLAAVAILRLDEEMEDFDNRWHLQGVIRILNQMPSLCSGGGLGEAAAWLCLRQDCYISLINQRPLQVNPAIFENCASLAKNDDLSWTNRMVLLCANVLSAAYVDVGHDRDRIITISEQIDCWMRDKPSTFDPIRVIRRGKSSDRRFPTTWMLSPFHVIGIQYYHIAKLVLAATTPTSQSGMRHHFWRNREVEKQVRNHLLMIVGLAKSNPRAENAMFQARHMLQAYGDVLTNKLDQEEAKAFLEDMERRTGWSMRQLLANLNQQWSDSDNED